MNKAIHLNFWRHLSTLLFLVCLMPLSSYAQDCDASSGSLSSADTLFCKKDTIRPTLILSSTESNFNKELIVVGESGQILFNTSDTFLTNLDFGKYNIHSFVYDQNDPPSSPPQEGGTIGDIQNSEAGCFDISSALIIEIRDTLAPMAVCAEFVIELYVDENGELGLTPSDFDFGSTDDCSGIDTIFLDREILGCIDLGAQQVTLSVQDSVGNIGACTTDLLIRDTLPPVLECANREVALNPLGFAEISLEDFSIEIGPSCLTNQVSIEKEILDCSDLGTNDFQIYVSSSFEDYSRLDSCTIQLTVVDTSGPSMQCTPGAVFLDSDGNAVVDAEVLDNGSRDLCEGPLVFSSNPAQFDCSTLGTQSIWLIGADQFGNQDSCQTNIAVIDTISPIAICGNENIYLDSDGNANIVVENIDQSTDNCAVTSRMISPQNVDCSDLDSVDVQLTVEDFSGNSSSCNIRLGVLDTFPPIANCMDAQIVLDERGVGILSPTAINDNSEDNCGTVASISLDRNRFDCDDLPFQNIVLSVSDASGNTDTCHARVEIKDELSPSVSCADTIVYLDANGMANIDSDFLLGSVEDNCGLVENFRISSSSFDCNDIGSLQVRLYAYDASNNVDSCDANVMIRDTVAPEAICKDVEVYTKENGLALLDPADLNDGSFDICSEIRIVDASEDRFTCGDLGPNSVNLYITDLYGNIDSCVSIVTVIDTIKPTLSCLDLSIYLNEQGNVSLAPTDVDPRAFDNCGIIGERSLSQSFFDCSNIGEQEVRLYVEDGSGVLDSCTSKVTVLDTIRPMALCQDFELELGSDGEAILTSDLINNQSFDNCSDINFDLSKGIFLCSDLGPNEVTLYVEDAQENLDSCSAIVTVVDNNQPQIFVQNQTIFLDQDGKAQLTPEMINFNSTDNCSIDSMWLDKEEFTCAEIGQNLVLLTIRDIDGNTNDETAIVTVVDNTLPELTCPASSIVNTSLDGNGACEFVVFDTRFDPQNSTDNCSIQTLTHNVENADTNSTLIGAVLVMGINEIEWVIKDANGLEASCSFTLTIVDDEKPIANCKDTVVVDLDANGMLTIDSMVLDQGSEDNCGITSYLIDRTDFSCIDIGFQTVNISMSDAAGNSSECSVVVGIRGSEACIAPEMANAGGPEIADPCSCRGNGAFDEEIVIGPTTKNQVWTVKSTTLLHPVTLQAYPQGTPFNEIPINADSSIYTLQGVHLDGDGYLLTAESPTFNDLSISNICYYPDLEILGLDGAICLFTEIIPLEASVNNTSNGSGQFTINGQVETEFNPMALGVGTHIVTYTFDAGDPASLNDPDDVGCVNSVTKEVEVTETNPFFACNDLVSVTTNVSCEIEVVPQMILNGNYLCYDDYQVFLALGNESVPNPVPSNYAGEVLRALVQHQPSGRICFGNIWLRDVTGPQITECPADINTGLICTDVDSIFNNPLTLDSTSQFFTGIPEVEDNCTGTTITFDDFLVSNGTCDANAVASIRRVFRVEDQFGNASTCEQFINFVRPDTVYFPTRRTISIDCNDEPLALDGQGNISPSVSGAPFVINGFGDTLSLLDNRICGFLLTYRDISQEICGSQTAYIRTWSLFDQCVGGTSREENQVIEVGDFTAPIVSCPILDFDFDGQPDEVPVYSTSPFDCTADITIPMPEVIECSDYNVNTRIYTWQTEDRFGFPLQDSIFTELAGVVYGNGTAGNIPVGRHFFVFSVRDDCNNTTRDTCLFRVEDQIAPVAFCDDDIIVSLSSPSISRVYPEDIDEGSRDNCDGTDVLLELRRLVPEDCSEIDESFYTDWGPHVDLDCCDAGKLITVELRVSDKTGNQNICVSRLQVRDNIRPECIPPFNISIDCDQLSGGFDPTDIDRLQNSFGIPTVLDNCGASWDELEPLVVLDECNIGTITRQFRVTDNANNVSQGACQQVITVRAVYDYSIKFPADAEATCGEFNSDSIEVFERACDMLAINVEDSDFNLSPGACFKIERRYRVINWCEYDGISAPIVVSRDADCDGEPGDEDVWVHVNRDQRTFIDRNNDPLDDIPVENTKGTSCDGLSNPNGYWIGSEQTTTLRSRGYWEYTQFISVIDDVDPTISFSDLPDVCSENDQCNALVSYPITISENCTPEDLDIEVIVDLNNDQISDFALLADSIQGTYPNYALNSVFPLGTHRLIVQVRDGCGNSNQEILTFTVIDCRAPGPICRDGMIVELSRLPEPVDVNGDQVLDLASGMLAANAFEASPVADCSGPVFYSINRVGESADPNLDSILLTCDDEGIVLVEVHAWDQAGNNNFCSTFIDVQNNSDACREIPQGAISGIIQTETTIPVPEVEVMLSGTQQLVEPTIFNGSYSFLELEEQGDYTVRPVYDVNDRLGVSTFDLILIRKHILGAELLESPYKIIAADANNSRNISVFDLILLQKLILGIDIELSDNDSWRFVDAQHIFTDPFNPWLTPIPGIININNLDREYPDADFIAVKIGDVNNSINLSGVGPVNPRAKTASVYLEVAETKLEAGESISIPFYLSDLVRLEGFQFGLKWDKTLLEVQEIAYAQLGAGNIGFFQKEGFLTTSWYNNDESIDPELPLFELQLKANQATDLADALQLSSRITEVEAYQKDGQLADIALRFAGGEIANQNFELFQNRPNPVGSETFIDLYIPVATEGRLSIYTQNGTVVREMEQDFQAGKYSYRFEAAALPAGILYYRFESAAFTETKKMVVIK